MFLRAEVHAQLAAGYREARGRSGDPEVARDRELHARADRGTVHRRDHGRPVADDRVERLLERRTERVDDRFALVRVFEAGDEVGARAERGARAGDHDGTEVGLPDRGGRAAARRARR